MNISPSGIYFDDLFIEVLPLIADNPCLKKLNGEELRWHLMWYWQRGTMSWAVNPEGKYTGICLIKLFNDLQNMDDWYVHEPNGRYLLVEEVVSDGPATWRRLFEQLYQLWGPREYVLWDRRDKTKNNPRIYTWGQYIKILRRLTHGYQLI